MKVERHCSVPWTRVLKISPYIRKKISKKYTGQCCLQDTAKCACACISVYMYLSTYMQSWNFEESLMDSSHVYEYFFDEVNYWKNKRFIVVTC